MDGQVAGLLLPPAEMDAAVAAGAVAGGWMPPGAGPSRKADSRSRTAGSLLRTSPPGRIRGGYGGY